MFEPILQFIIPTLWLGWLLYWIVSARDVKPTRWREPAVSSVRHRVPLLLGTVLLVAPRLLPHVLRERVLPGGIFFPVLGALLVTAGLILAIYARRHLGRNWSANVTVKENHVLIRTGPYRYVRHPIYTGILLGFLGTAVAVGEWRGVLAVALALAAFVWKSRVEEDRMRAIFPDYEQYRKGTAALIPLVF